MVDEREHFIKESPVLGGGIESKPKHVAVFTDLNAAYVLTGFDNSLRALNNIHVIIKV